MQPTTDQGYVRSATHNGITTIEFFHPQSNSLPRAILRQLAEAFNGYSKDEATHVIVLRSGGDRTFCAGASFAELSDITTEAEGLAFFSGFAEVINAMRSCKKLIIGRVQGKCVGGGVGLAAAADYCIALHTAEIKLSELAVGIGPFVVGPVIERNMGAAAFRQLAIDATVWRSADWAKRHGLFAELHEDLQSLDQSVMHLAETLSLSNPEAMTELKKVFWKGTEHWEQLLMERAAISGRLAISEFTKEAINRFKTKAR
jgi:methylglutaconyl-CoA hydratase